MATVLITGCGNIAGGFDAQRVTTESVYTHAGGYSVHGGFELRGCVEPEPVRREAFMQRWHVDHGYASLQEVAQQDLRFDVISICSPTRFHADDLHLAMSLRPKLVFCEKPLTSTLAESQSIAKQYHDAGIALLVNYTRRWDERVRTLARQLRHGEWGHVRSASAVYNKGLYNNGSHMLDLLTLLLGSLTVLASGSAVVDMWEDDPSVSALLVSAAGVPVTLNCAHAADYSLFEFELVTECGVIKMENGGLDWQVRRAGSSAIFPGYKTLGAPEYTSGTLGGAAIAAVSEIAQMLSSANHPPSCTADDAIAVQVLCEAIRTASK